jgi:2-oxo-4-hydroxy-4-carboxy-5-ureidoimidazoline decarboxylase
MRATEKPPTLASLSNADRARFVSVLGDIFEHSPWVAEQAWIARPFASVEALHRAMLEAMWGARAEQQLQLISAHPELAGKEADEGTLTADSKTEQAGAGLDRCTAAELARLRELNRAYREKFGFPFVMAVKGRTKNEILAAIEARLQGQRDEEFRRCLEEIGTIGGFRLTALLGQGR